MPEDTGGVASPEFALNICARRRSDASLNARLYRASPLLLEVLDMLSDCCIALLLLVLYDCEARPCDVYDGVVGCCAVTGDALCGGGVLEDSGVYEGLGGLRSAGVSTCVYVCYHVCMYICGLLRCDWGRPLWREGI
jgi:hypothetical protein